MSTMALPAHGSQDRLISEVARVNKNTIVVNNTGVPISMPWLSSTSAVLQVWFPGMEAGNSIADVLFGVANPGGKLPVTFPRLFEDTPCYGNFPGDLEKLEVRYEEDVFVGYRFYDRHPDKVLFPFGFGLSYTSFSLRVVDDGVQRPAERTVVVKVEVRNIGKVTGSEVVQVYLGPAKPSDDRSLKTLGGFSKVRLGPGEVAVVDVEVDLEAAALWDDGLCMWRIHKGEYEVLVGSSAADIVDRQRVTVEDEMVYEP